MAEPIDRETLLLVEGKEDKRFWDACFRARGRTDVSVRQGGGKTTINQDLPIIARTPGFDQVRWLGVIQDADHSASAAFDRIREALRRQALPVPAAPRIPIFGVPTVVAIVLPDGVNHGDLEELVWQAVRDEPSAACVDQFIDCLDRTNLVPRQESKARVHAYLASLARPDLRLAEAAERGLLPLASPVFDRVLSLLP